MLASLGVGSANTAGRDGSDSVAPGDGVLGKRKRREDKEVAELADDLRLPATWGQWLKKSGSGAVVVFVDAASMQSAFRECKRVVREGGAVEWSGAEGLGEKRECVFPLLLALSLTFAL